MKIVNIEVKPFPNSLVPELNVKIDMVIRKGIEIPIEIIGSLYSEDNLKLGNMQKSILELNKTLELSAYNIQESKDVNISTEVLVPLSQKALEHISNLREKNLKGDVILNLNIYVKLLISRTSLSNMYFTKENEDPFSNKAKPIFYKYTRGFSTTYSNMWILSGDSGPTFIELHKRFFKEQKIISSSDWIHDFCPEFQIGKFFVFEYPLLDYLKGLDSIEERLNNSINSLKKMEKSIIDGDWNKVIEDSRGISEILKNYDEIKDLFIRDGYTEEAFENLNESIKNLFNFSSKFHHKLDQSKKKITGEIKASKEDAYLIFTISTTLVNLISKKIQRLS